MRLVSDLSIVPTRRKDPPQQGDGTSGVWQMADGRAVPYASTIERRFVELCDWAHEVRSIQWEPFRLRFFDCPDERHRFYTPDYLVELATGAGSSFRYVIEVKAYQRYMKEFVGEPTGFANRAIIAGTAYARQQPGCDFAVITERWVESRGIRNVRLIRQACVQDDNIELQSLMVGEILTKGGAVLSSLVQLGVERGFSRADTVTQVLKLCGADAIHFDIRHPLGDGSRFDAGPRQKVFKI